MPTSPFIILAEICQPPRLFRPPLLLEIREHLWILISFWILNIRMMFYISFERKFNLSFQWYRKHHFSDVTKIFVSVAITTNKRPSVKRCQLFFSNIKSQSALRSIVHKGGNPALTVLGKRERKWKKNKQDSSNNSIFVKIYNMLQTRHMFLASELIKNLHAATFASMLMKSSGLLHEAVKGPFSVCKHILSIFWDWKRLFSKHTDPEQKIHQLKKKSLYPTLKVNT